MKIKIDNYVFDASAQTITFSDYTTIDLSAVLLIINTTDNIIIYNFLDSTAGGTAATNVLTLTYNTTAMSDTDDLLVYYDDTAAPVKPDGTNIMPSIDDPIRRGFFSSVNKYNLKWQSDTDFNKGTYTDTEISGTGDSAIVQLFENADNSDDITFATSANYTLSDGTKLTVTGGLVKLKALTGSETDWTFTTAGNYTYDSTKIEVTSGIAKLLQLNRYIQYHLNASSGTTVTDSSGNSRDGTTVNIEDSDWVAGKLNNCLRFDGVNEYVNCGNVAAFERTDSFSIEAWVKTSSSNQMIISKNNDSRGWQFYILSGGNLFVSLDNNISGGNRITRLGSTAINDDTWHHVVFTYDGTSQNTGIKIYVNTVEEGTGGTNALSDTIVGTIALNLASKNNGSTLYTGDIDEIVIYDKELSQAEVTARYNSGAGTEEVGYATDNPTIVPNTGFSFASALEHFTETSTKPTGSEIKYHVSSDDGSTWKYWTGAAWVVTDDTYTQANTATDIDTNIGTLASSGTFKFRSLLNSDGEVTPELDNIHTGETLTYSTTDNLYVDTKDASQIAPTTIYSWLTTTIINTLPVNTDIRLLFSNNGRSSWLTWSGSAWVAPTSATTRTDATSITDAQTNFNDIPLGSDTLDVRLFLRTTDNTSTPDVSNINVTSDTGFKTSGTYESNEYDSGYSSLDWGNASWTITLTSGTTLTFTARAGNISGNLGSYGSTLINGADSNVTGRYIQWKCDFVSPGISTPTIEDFDIEYITPAIREINP